MDIEPIAIEPPLLEQADQEIAEQADRVSAALHKRIRGVVTLKLPFVTANVASEVADAVSDAVTQHLQALFDV
jgi:hypothetical protein